MRGVIVATVLALLAGCAERVEWIRVADEREGFLVEMPGTPEKVTREIQLPFGRAPVHMWVVQDGDRAFIAGYTEYPPRVGDVTSDDELLDSARDRAVAGAAAHLLSEEAVELRGHRGRRLRMEARDGAVIVRGALFVAGSRLYQVLATTTPDEADTERVDRFLASFDLPPPGAVAAGPGP